MNATKIFHDGHHLKIALRLMQAACPWRFHEVVEACRNSRWERRCILRNLRSHIWWGMMRYYHHARA